jgi:hypothetical protein
MNGNLGVLSFDEVTGRLSGSPRAIGAKEAGV